jgi:hypothetical protein
VNGKDRSNSYYMARLREGGRSMVFVVVVLAVKFL